MGGPGGETIINEDPIGTDAAAVVAGQKNNIITSARINIAVVVGWSHIIRT